jgi:hypothetical protein
MASIIAVFGSAAVGVTSVFSVAVDSAGLSIVVDSAVIGYSC